MEMYPKMSLVVLLFMSCCVVSGVPEDLDSLKETVRVLRERMDGLQKLLEDLLHINDISSFVPQTTDESKLITNSETLGEKTGTRTHDISIGCHGV